MWIITPWGFFSIVDKGGRKGQLCVRARDGEDLDRLRDTYLPRLGPTIDNEGTDYAFRAFAPRGAVAKAMAAAVKDITYDNMKDETFRQLGAKREGVYHRIWSALLALEPVGAWRGRTLWDDDDWDDDVIELPPPKTFKCWVCDTEVPLFQGELADDLSDEDRLAEVNKIGLAITRECEYNDTGNHWGTPIEEALSA
jgi:hypothetical protein